MHPSVTSFQHPDPRALNEELCRSIYAHKLVDRGKRRNNDLGGWHSTTQDLGDRPGFPELVTYIKSLAPIPVGPYLIWTIVNPKGVGNARHGHRPDLLAACYYPKMPDPTPAIVFHEGAVEYPVKPLEGQLLFFGGGLEHSVEVNQTDSDRIVIALDFECLQG